MELLLIRHLPTEWNQKGILQGSNDIALLPLSVEEISKMEKNIKKIAGFQPQLVLVSELIRTQQTAQHYGYDQPCIDPLLNELNFGEYEGVEKAQLMKVKEWTENPRSMILGERLLDFENRIIQFIQKYNKFSCILVFGHGSWIRGLLSIERVGTIQKMNKVTVNNNELIHIKFKL